MGGDRYRVGEKDRQRREIEEKGGGLTFCKRCLVIFNIKWVIDK